MSLKEKKIGISFIVLGFTILSLIIFFPSDIPTIYVKNYFFTSLCLIICEILLLNRFLFYKLDIFEPIVTISFFYIVMYFITPIYDIIIGEYLWYGYDLFEFGIKGSFIALLGYLIFYIIYYLGEGINLRKKKINKITFKINNEYIINTRKKAVFFIMVMYLICFFANSFYLVKANGNNLIYLLSLGMLGDGGTENTINAPIGFISMLSYSLPTVTLLYWEFGKNKLLKIGLFIPMLLLQVARGFRFFVIQILITFFSYYYLKNKKRPTLKTICIFILLSLIPILLMTLFRESIRNGTGVNLSEIKFSIILEGFDQAFWENLRIYKNFYGMVGVIPNLFPYVYFRQIIVGTMVMIIPRIIWPGKISTYGGEGLVTLIGSNIASGQAYPNIGEYYYSCGIFGVIFFMGLYSLWMRRVKNKYMNGGRISLVIFSVLLGANLQLIIRGYTPSNFWYVVFSILPAYILEYLISRKVLRNEKE